jgi:transcriptional regulator with XRE-family HTH domain
LLGRTLRERRALSGLSQDDLARAAGIDVKTIRNIEAGRNKPRPSTLRLLADALGIEGKDRDQLFAAAAPIRSAIGQTPVPTPAQLPADVRFFAGRDAHLASLHAALDVASTSGSSTVAVPIVAISGSAGVGKPNPGFWHKNLRLYCDVTSRMSGLRAQPAPGGDIARGYASSALHGRCVQAVSPVHACTCWARQSLSRMANSKESRQAPLVKTWSRMRAS